MHRPPSPPVDNANLANELPIAEDNDGELDAAQPVDDEFEHNIANDIEYNEEDAPMPNVNDNAIANAINAR